MESIFAIFRPLEARDVLKFEKKKGKEHLKEISKLKENLIYTYPATLVGKQLIAMKFAANQ